MARPGFKKPKELTEHQKELQQQHEKKLQDAISQWKKQQQSHTITPQHNIEEEKDCEENPQKLLEILISEMMKQFRYLTILNLNLHWQPSP